MFTDQVTVEIDAYYKGKSLRPDVDNVAKSILDGMNKIAYRDDELVQDLHIRKHLRGQPPRIEIRISESKEKTQ